MLADDGPPTTLGQGRTNPYQQASGNGSSVGGSQPQRKRPREDGDFLDNRPLSQPLGAAGGPLAKRQLEAISNNNNNSNSNNNSNNSDGQQNQLLQTSNPAHQLGQSQIVSFLLLLGMRILHGFAIEEAINDCCRFELLETATHRWSTGRWRGAADRKWRIYQSAGFKKLVGWWRLE